LTGGERLRARSIRREHFRHQCLERILSTLLRLKDPRSGTVAGILWQWFEFDPKPVNQSVATMAAMRRRQTASRRTCTSAQGGKRGYAGRLGKGRSSPPLLSFHCERENRLHAASQGGGPTVTFEKAVLSPTAEPQPAEIQKLL